MDADEATRVGLALRNDMWRKEAASAGRIAGEAAASWLDPVNDEQACKMLLAIVTGDDTDWFMPRTPDLSGEYAGDPTPQSVFRDVTGGIEVDGEEVAEEQDLVEWVCLAWEEAADSRMQEMVELRLRQYLAPE